MNSIAARSSSTLPTPPTASTESATDSPQGGDLLAAMNPAMDAAFAVGRPTDSQGAAAILATTGAYIAGANATITKLDEGIERREKELEQLRLSDPDAAKGKESQLELLKQLRDRIQLSIERVSRSAAGEVDPDDVAAVRQRSEDLDLERKSRERREELELLEQRRALLAPTSITATKADSGAVASTYAATASRTS